ncbi:MAG: hypothetical protein J6T41_00305, partial [Neisseriaceae bacterium]|nr:hypothetical protein [Neisseriaceae bacterium]
ILAVNMGFRLLSYLGFVAFFRFLSILRFIKNISGCLKKEDCHAVILARLAITNPPHRKCFQAA